MKSTKKSGSTSRKAKESEKPDNQDIISRYRKAWSWDQIATLEDFIGSFGVSPTEGTVLYPCHYQGAVKTRTRAYRFRLDPDPEQKSFLDKHFGAVRWVYNHYLEQRKRQYKERGDTDGYPQQAKDLTRLKKEEGKEWLREMCSQPLQQALRHLEDAYKNFKEGRARFPRFHSKFGKNTFCIPQNVRIEGDRLWLPKLKSGIRIKLHRGIGGKIGSVTFTRTPTGEYYASFCVTELVQELAPNPRAVGLDLGLKDVVITSDNCRYPNNRHLKKRERRLAREQRCLSRKKKGSRGYLKQKIKVAKTHEKIRNCRNDDRHKCALSIVRNYGVICIENLNVRGMMRNGRSSKSIADASWGTLVNMLKYKADWYGRIVIQIDRFYPSSQICSSCGYKNKAVKDLKVRQWDCPNCGTHHDRDENAARNLLLAGLEKLWDQVKSSRQTPMAE